MSFTSNQRNHLCWQMWVKKFKNLKRPAAGKSHSMYPCCLEPTELYIKNSLLQFTGLNCMFNLMCMSDGAFSWGMAFYMSALSCSSWVQSVLPALQLRNKGSLCSTAGFLSTPLQKKKKRKKKGSLCRSVGLDQILMIAHSRRNQSSSADYSSILKEGTWSQPSTWGKKIKLKFCSLPFI